MLPVLDIVGWHHEAQGPCCHYMHLYQLYPYWWSQYFLTSKDSYMGTPRARWVLTCTCLHASTFHWLVCSVCPYRFIPIPSTHIQPFFQPLPIPPKLPNQLARKDWSARLYAPDRLPFLGT